MGREKQKQPKTELDKLITKGLLKGYLNVVINCLLVLLVLLGPITVGAAIEKSGYCRTLEYGSAGLIFTEDANGSYSVKADSFAKLQGEIIIPSTYNGKPVESIAARAFEGLSGITSVIIPDTVTQIGAGAFDGTGLPIVNGVMYAGRIDENSLSKKYHEPLESSIWAVGCDKSALPAELVLDTAAVGVVVSAFSGAAIETLAIGGGLRFVNNLAFSDCASLAAVNIDHNNAQITLGKLAFPNSEALSVNVVATDYWHYKSVFSKYPKTKILPYLNDGEVYLIFNSNTDATAPVQVLTVGDTASAAQLNGLSKTGYHLAGWFDNPELSGEAVDLAAPQLKSAYLYARWEPNRYTIKFDANGGSGEMADINAVYDNTESLPENTFTHSELPFGGWLLNGEVLEERQEVGNLTADNNGIVTIKAVWMQSVTFDANGGVGEMPVQYVGIGVTASLNKNLFTKEDYHFIGWSLLPNGEKDYGNGGNITLPDTAVMLYAIWEYGTAGLKYRYTGSSKTTVGVSGYEGEATSVKVPATYLGYDVVDIFEKAFDGCTKVYEICVDSGVDDISDGAFSGCSNLQRLSVPWAGRRIYEISYDMDGEWGVEHYPFGVLFGRTEYPGSTLITQETFEANTYNEPYFNVLEVAYYIPATLTEITITAKDSGGMPSTYVLGGCFKNFRNLQRLTLADNVRWDSSCIEDAPLGGCSSLITLVCGCPYIDFYPTTYFSGALFGTKQYSGSSGHTGYVYDMLNGAKSGPITYFVPDSLISIITSSSYGVRLDGFNRVSADSTRENYYIYQREQ